MGYMRHHAIVVTGYDLQGSRWITGVHLIAQSIFPWVSPLSPESVNGYRSFFIPPDGSKEGWTESAEGDRARERFVEELRKTYFSDGSSAIKWVEVQYGDDEWETKALQSSDQDYLKIMSESGHEG